MPIGDSWFQSGAVADPRLAPHAASLQPTWLWSADGSRILWCNEAGAAALGVDARHLLATPRSPADPHGRQVAQLARRLAPGGPTRLERLRGFGARLGQLTTCACSRLEQRDGEAAILVVAIEAALRIAPSATMAAASAQGTSADDVVPREAVTEEALPETPAPDRPIYDVGGGPDVALLADISFAAQIRDEDVASPGPREEAGARGEPDQGVQDPRTHQQFVSTAAPLRFVWQIDAAGRFSLTSDEFLRIAGERTALIQGQAWPKVVEALDLDPHGRLTQAIAGCETFSRLAAQWPLEHDARGRIELSGMPILDSTHAFAGYRGFGIYRSATLASDDPDLLQPEAAPTNQPASELSDNSTPAAAAAAPDDSWQRETDTVEPPQNVVPFPLVNDTRVPSLSPVENHAFDEIARRLTQNFDDTPQQTGATAAPEIPASQDAPQEERQASPSQTEQPAWLAAAAIPPRGESATDRMLLDLMPSGILIYRLDRLLYANHAFLVRTGYDNLHALQDAGGLDALYVEPATASASSTSDEGMPLTIAPSGAGRAPSGARLFSILWDGETAHALILQGAQAVSPEPAATPTGTPPQPAKPAAQPDDNAFEAILETATDGIVLFDRSGAIVSANRSAQALFDIGAQEFRTLNFADLFVDESQRIVLDYFESLDAPAAASPVDHGREVLGCVRGGGFIPLSMTMGRLGDTGERSAAVLQTAMSERFFAVFRDLSQQKRNESDLLNARRKADRATAAKADALASISHEIRGPLNTIIGFSNIMIEERFGSLGNDRYAEYLKDIRASGERAIAILDDIVNLSSIETGDLDLRPVRQNLNEMVEQCVGMLQPQANRERVIIRTSLAHGLPQVMADTQALRQITMNIVTSSIRFSRAGGQVIVSTAPADNGGAILRVRDTGRGLSDAEVASMNSRHAATDRSTIDLSLARALAEANRAQFQIRTTEGSGTLIEVAFANVRALAG